MSRIVKICKKWPLFGAKICTDICRQPLSVPRCVQFRETDHVWGKIYKHIFVLSRGYCVYYPSNILQRKWKNVYEQPYCIQRGMFSFRCFPLRLHEQKTNLSGHFNEVKSLRYPIFGILKYGPSPCKQVTVLATVFKNKFSGYIAAPIKGGGINEVIVLLRWL